jgi:hypothetical protein
MKTVKSTEEKILFGSDSLITKYHEYMMRGEDTLLSRIYGVYKMKLSMMDEPICFLIMDSLINYDYQDIERLYDLKGST